MSMIIYYYTCIIMLVSPQNILHCWNNGMPPGMPECGGSSTQVRKNTINRSTVPVRTGAVQQGKNYRE